eukprot:TRINITY_DN6718_c0_g1_i1.p1 TRINITY_DN6718_c0_g1~~TRINITY_DN6718_c0_g1_i1.p1  ORF type:complete len:167 (-),score=29.53 TRINITY_DN6718_c0_g1_i1:124-624(-)
MEGEEEDVREVVLPGAGVIFKWLVSSDTDVKVSQELLQYKQPPSNALHMFVSPFEGKISQLYPTGKQVQQGQSVAQIHTCLHSISWGGICSNCGKDISQNYTEFDDDDRIKAPSANIRIIPSARNLLVSQKETENDDAETVKRCFKTEKLSLVIDIDQTLLHATHN